MSDVLRNSAPGYGKFTADGDLVFMSKISLEASVGYCMLGDGVDSMLLTEAATGAGDVDVVEELVVPCDNSESDISSGIIMSHEVWVS